MPCSGPGGDPNAAEMTYSGQALRRYDDVACLPRSLPRLIAHTHEGRLSAPFVFPVSMDFLTSETVPTGRGVELGVGIN